LVLRIWCPARIEAESKNALERYLTLELPAYNKWASGSGRLTAAFDPTGPTMQALVTSGD